MTFVKDQIDGFVQKRRNSMPNSGVASFLHQLIEMEIMSKL